MKQRSGLQKKIYRMTYDRPKINQCALLLKKSLDEVQKILSQGIRKPRLF
jgi:hypothetical protein